MPVRPSVCLSAYTKTTGLEPHGTAGAGVCTNLLKLCHFSKSYTNINNMPYIIYNYIIYNIIQIIYKCNIRHNTRPAWSILWVPITGHLRRCEYLGIYPRICNKIVTMDRFFIQARATSKTADTRNLTTSRIHPTLNLFHLPTVRCRWPRPQSV
jgi:hypothetical protein